MVNAAYSFADKITNKQMGMPYEEGSVRGGKPIKGVPERTTMQREPLETFTICKQLM